MSTITLDPARINPGIWALSGGNLIAKLTAGTGSTYVTVFGRRYQSTGKFYYEATCNAVVFGANIGPGWANSFGLPDSFIGNSNSVSLRNDGVVVYNGGTSSTFNTWAVGATICCAIDIDNKKVWWRVNGGNWNNNATFDPGTNTGGFDITTIWTSNNYFVPAIAMVSTNDQFTFNFGASAYAQTVPTGFGNWVEPTVSAWNSEIRAQNTHGQTPPTPSQHYSGEQFNYKLWSPAAVMSSISGTVSEAGSPVSKKVFLYDEVSGVLLGATLSSAVDGSYSIPALGRTKVFAVALDNPTYQALVYDNITPG